ncbi:hypothetical protein PFISCL1PPCAC_6125, partial [Pristionchus fissidentatus]
LILLLFYTDNVASRVCPISLVPFIEEGTGRSRHCDRGILCPTGYSCINDLCCGPPGQCPSPYSLLYEIDGSPLACSSSSSCPISSLCLPSSTISQSLCCSSLDCPSTHRLPGDRIQLCQSPSDCPAGSQCVISGTSSRTRMCCQSLSRPSLQNRRNVCPSGWNPFGSSIKACSLSNDLPMCPRGSSCLQSPLRIGEMYCCTPGVPRSSSSSSSLNQCSPGQTEQLNGVGRECSIEEPYCSSGFTCERTSISSFFCCSSSPLTTQQPSFSCGVVGETPAVSTTGSNLFCNQVGVRNTCPQSALCRSASNSVNMLICCYSSSEVTPICPNNGIPQPSVTGFYPCDISQPSNQCDQGYSCKRAANDFNTHLCCSSTLNQNNQPICPNQATLLQEGGNPVYCDQFPCQSGYSCEHAVGSPTIVICCSSSSPSSQTCPSSFTPVLDPRGTTISCSPNEPASCPSGSQCLDTPTLYICCQSTTSARICPNNQNALLTPTGFPERCTGPGTPCSKSGYTCQLSPLDSQWVCCGQEATSASCADGSDTYQQVPGQTYTCSLLSFPSSCPSGYSCATSTLSGMNVCCRSTSRGGCPLGWNPYRNDVTKTTKTCTGVTDESCPTGYSCTPSSSSSSSPFSSSFICCRLADSPRCPSSSTYLLNSQPRLCSSSKLNQCPIGFQCTSSTVPSISICCSTSPSTSLPLVTCPDGSSPAMLNSMPRFCPTPGSTDGCPNQYQCLLLNQMNVCCRRRIRSSLLIGESRSFPISRSIINPCGLAAEPLIHNNATVDCFNEASICPSSHPCRKSSSSSWLCCQAAQCPSGVRVGDDPLLCTSTPDCPPHAHCTDALNIKDLRICCALPPDPSSRCLGRGTQLHGGRPVPCLLGSLCESPFTCSSLTSDSSPLCCENERDSVAICTEGRIPLRNLRSDEIVFCGGREPKQVCIDGFECLRGKIESRSVCCSEKPVCPSERIGLTDENGEIKRLAYAKSSDCSPGFECSDSSVPHIFLCCQIPPSLHSNSSRISTALPSNNVNWLQIEPAN